MLLILLFVFFGIPLAGSMISAGFSILTGIIGGLLGIFGGLLGLIAAGFAGTVGLVCGGFAMIVRGAAGLAAPSVGLMQICLGFFLLAGAFLLAALTKWSCFTAAPGLFRFSIELVQKGFGWLVGAVRRIFSRGGAAK